MRVYINVPTAGTRSYLCH